MDIAIKRILIIPHHPELPHLKIRLIEIAKNLSKKHIIYLVDWRGGLGKHSLCTRIYSTLRDLCEKVRFYKKDKLTIVKFPIIHRPLCLVPKFNSFWLTRIIEREKIDVVINGAYYMFNIPEKRKFKYILDFADLPVSEKFDYFEKFIQSVVAREIRKADAVTVVSKGLVDYVSTNYGYKSFLIPNGANIQKLRLIDKAKIEKIKKMHNLLGRYVIGYIGYIGKWVDVKFVTDVFERIKKKIPEAVLIWIGPSSDLNQLKKRYAKEGIIFTNGIRDEIAPYFQTLDVGILPHEKSFFQDVAFHIKLIEYTAAKKMVISSPLNEVKKLGFPNILTANLSINEWVEAIEKVRQIQWDYEWDKLVEPYDWDNIVNKLCNIIESIKK